MPKKPVDNTEEPELEGADEAALEPEVLDASEPSSEELEAAEPAEDSRALMRRGFASRAPSSGGSLTRHDPLAAYMRDVQRYTLLTPEQEHDLAVHYTKTGDVDAARQLVTANLRLVVKIAYDYRRAYKNLLDLVQEGNIGLMQAVKKYDPYKGVKLSSYAAWWIRAYMLRFILNNHRLVKVGTTQAQRKLFFNLRKEKARLEAMGIAPTPETIATRLNVSKEDVEQMDLRLSAGEASLDAPVGGDEGRSVSRVDLLPARGSSFEDVLANEELTDLMSERIHEFGETLTGKEATIFVDRLVADEPRTLQSLGEEFGVSRERVRQIEKRVLEKLRKHLKEEVADDVLDVYGELGDS
ncbi:MAG: RNA polymerase factor sigma-32 [Myxococcales bacterium]|nr:RNA polymerase factor sigma-32 [Myxococcales bacterium]